MTIQHYVKFLYPGAFFSEESSKKIKDRNLVEILSDLPPNAFAFQFYDHKVFTATREDGMKMKDVEVVDESGMYYPGGAAFTLDEIKAMGESHKILAANMKGNGWPKVVKTRCGNFQPLNDNDVVIDIDDLTPVGRVLEV